MERRTAEMKEKENTSPAEPISLRIPSSPKYVLLARLVVTQVGQIAGLEQDEIYDLKLAVTEAVTNAIRHAKVKSFEIEYSARPQVVEITVKDAGGGFEVEDLTKVPDSQGGFGLAVIGSLVDEVMLDSTEQDGTQLKMVYRSSSSQKVENT
jgi:serine/threonine-protein kinase RsbW